LTTESLQLPKILMENKNTNRISSYSKIIINYYQGSFVSAYRVGWYENTRDG